MDDDHRRGSFELEAEDGREGWAIHDRMGKTFGKEGMESVKNCDRNWAISTWLGADHAVHEFFVAKARRREGEM